MHSASSTQVTCNQRWFLQDNLIAAHTTRQAIEAPALRMKGELSRRRRVNADAADRYAVAQRGLKPKPHLILFPGSRPAPICAVSHDKERSDSAAHDYR